MHRPCRRRMFDRHKLGVRCFVLIPLEMRSYLHPPQQTFPLSPFSGFTLSAGHKTIAPSRHRMAHVKHRPRPAGGSRHTGQHLASSPNSTAARLYMKSGGQWPPRSFHLHYACLYCMWNGRCSCECKTRERQLVAPGILGIPLKPREGGV
jgi:hypothetical protein